MDNPPPIHGHFVHHEAPPPPPHHHHPGAPLHDDHAHGHDEHAIPHPPIVTGPTCFPPVEEFAEDVDLRLGRANGNVYQVRPGIDGVHDGRIMIRLKKKRFILLDYGVSPTEDDVAVAAVNPHVAVPTGGGKAKCVTSTCPKVGVPVLLYDSDPMEPASLYLRSGLCFSCQRVLNEKRRTQRKRKSDTTNTNQYQHVHPVVVAAAPQYQHQLPPPILSHAHAPPPHYGHHLQAPMDDPHAHAAVPPPLLDHHHTPSASTAIEQQQQHSPYGGNIDATLSSAASAHASASASASQQPHSQPSSQASQKRFRLNGEIIDLSPDAIIINGPLEGTRHHDPANYSYDQIGTDLQTTVREASRDADDLIAKSVASCSNGGGGGGETTQEEEEVVLANYEKTFLSMSRGIFLLSQWKASWDTTRAEATATAAVAASSTDAAVGVAAHVDQTTEATAHLPGVTDQAVADAVATAAAAAAAQAHQSVQSVSSAVDDPPPTTTTASAVAGVVASDPPPHPNGHDAAASNMIPLLLAAEGEAKGEDAAGSSTTKDQENNDGGGGVGV